MSETPTSAPVNWGSIAIVVLAAFTAFIQTYQAFNGSDAKQNARLASIERVLCATDDVARKKACRLSGIEPT